MPQTDASTQDFPVPTGEQVYDMIMEQIEPELLTANIPHLDEPYEGETEDARKERYARYTKAFEAYDKAFAKWSTDLHEAVTGYRRTLFKEVEQQARAQDDDNLSSLEQQITAA